MDAGLIRVLNLLMNASTVILLTVLLVRLVRDNARLRLQVEHNNRLVAAALRLVQEEGSPDEGPGT